MKYCYTLPEKGDDQMNVLGVVVFGGVLLWGLAVIITFIALGILRLEH